MCVFYIQRPEIELLMNSELQRMQARGSKLSLPNFRNSPQIYVKELRKNKRIPSVRLDVSRPELERRAFPEHKSLHYHLSGLESALFTINWPELWRSPEEAGRQCLHFVPVFVQFCTMLRSQLLHLCEKLMQRR